MALAAPVLSRGVAESKIFWCTAHAVDLVFAGQSTAYVVPNCRNTLTYPATGDPALPGGPVCRPPPARRPTPRVAGPEGRTFPFPHRAHRGRTRADAGHRGWSAAPARVPGCGPPPRPVGRRIPGTARCRPASTVPDLAHRDDRPAPTRPSESS